MRFCEPVPGTQRLEPHRAHDDRHDFRRGSPERGAHFRQFAYAGAKALFNATARARLVSIPFSLARNQH
jgi:hypothetical protein